jgi:predicted RNase H-like nuclease (RuvC/YqgF family)
VPLSAEGGNMNNIARVALVAVVSLQLMAIGSFAEDKSAKQSKPAAQETQKKEVKTIFNYKTELGLSDKQVEDMKALVSKLQTTLNEKGKMLLDLRNDLAKMIREKDNLGTIKSQLKKIADLQVEISYMDIETARKIEGVLAPKQLKKWQDIQISSLDKVKAENTKATKK